MRLVKIDDEYFNPEQVVRLSPNSQDGGDITVIALTGSSQYSRESHVRLHIDKVAALLADEVVGAPE